MKVPVIRGTIGTWRYYSGVLSFKQIADNVQSTIKEFYEASCLSELLQRELTQNYENIEYYLLNDGERFFNSLVLAIYEGDPKWLEVEFPDYEDGINNVGFLQFSGKEIIFPVDGQHRVAGIKAALKASSNLGNEQVPVIFIAHENSPEGKKRTRKLFSTLNRRAKPVGDNENIALDEDDVCSIITRSLIDECKLFSGNRVINSPGKQIPTSNVSAFTSLITLYQCNEIIIKQTLKNEGITGKQFTDFKLFRPSQEKIDALTQMLFTFWKTFIEETRVISDFSRTPNESAKMFRNQTGGNILFRPVALTEYISAILIIKERSNMTESDIIKKLSDINMDLDRDPWRGVIWDGKSIITRVNKTLIRYLVIYMFNMNILSDNERDTLYEYYISATNSQLSKQDIREKLDSLQRKNNKSIKRPL